MILFRRSCFLSSFELHFGPAVLAGRGYEPFVEFVSPVLFQASFTWLHPVLSLMSHPVSLWMRILMVKAPERAHETLLLGFVLPSIESRRSQDLSRAGTFQFRTHQRVPFPA